MDGENPNKKNKIIIIVIVLVFIAPSIPFGPLSKKRGYSVPWYPGFFTKRSSTVLPKLLFPSGSNSGFMNGWNIFLTPRHPYPYYRNALYKKYIDDNNGECPLPLPEPKIDWIMSDTIPKLECEKYDRSGVEEYRREQYEIE